MSLRQIVEDQDTRAGQLFDLFIQILIAISLISFCVETLPDLSASTRWILRVIEWVTVAIFTTEYILRVLVARKKLGFIFSFYGLIDLLAILPFFLMVGIDLRSIRILRLFRLLRALKLIRYSRAIQRFHQAFRLMKEELILFSIACLFLVFIASVGIYYFERAAQPEAFQSIFHSMWWAIATLTTVGYGDVYPITVGGKIFTFIILMIGLGIIAVPAGLIASSMQETIGMEDDLK